MQAGSHSAVADGSSTLFPLGYSDHFQNHVMAGFPLGEDMISFSGGRAGVGEEYWSAAGKEAMEPRLARASPCLYESPKTAVDYSYQGLPFDAAARWDFSRGGELQQASIMNDWILTQQERFSKELSLSLASSHPIPELSCSSYPLHRRCVGSSCSSSKPATLLSGSRFFQAMQEILAEFACYALQNLDHHRASTNALEPEHRLVIHSSGKEAESKRKHLLSLLQVVDDQYNQCLDEIHTIVSAFHVVTELDPNLHARFALPAISLMYRSLRERISSHILAMGARHSEGDARQDSSFIQKQWALQQLKKSDHQLWRPQRGLPERSVSVLRAWMFQNFLHPYPKDAEKHLLALKSGLTRSQVSNWFINARVRLWKPMIEEMYAEMNRSKARRDEEESHRNQLSRRFTVE